MIRSVQSDRDHAVLEVVGALGCEGVDELRQRVEGLLVAGVRYLLVDITEACPCDAVMSGVLAEAARRLEDCQGWLRVNRIWPLAVGLDEATLADLFAIYRACTGTTSRPDGRDVR